MMLLLPLLKFLQTFRKTPTLYLIFFFNDTATTEIYTLSLHDALPICSWFSYKGQRIGQGRDSARQFLKENPELVTKLDGELRTVLGLLSTSENGSAKANAATAPQK